MVNPFLSIKKYLSEGAERSQKVKKNIFAMLFIKGGHILIGFLLVPLTLRYVDSDTYGIWLALSSMVAWMSFFDIGINNGLKNKLAEALAVGDMELGKKYVSTTYAFLALIFIPLMAILLAVSSSVNWESVLKITTSDTMALKTAVSIIVSYFCINFIFSTINVILQADQRPADESLRVFIQQLVTLAVVFILTKTTEGSLVKLCMALCACPLVVVLIFNFTLFKGRYKDIRPSLASIDFRTAPVLLKLGVMFFIIQIAYIVQNQMINFLIIRHFSASDVTAYNLAGKYFGTVYMVWTILTTPIWAAVTDAVTKGDYDWIRSTVTKFLKLFLLFTAGSVILLLLSRPFYHFWVGDAVSIPFSLSFWVMVYNLVFMFGNIFVSVLNGASILKLQTIASLLSPLVFIGISLLLIKNGHGVESVLVASVISNFYGLLLAPAQYYSNFRLKRCKE